MIFSGFFTISIHKQIFFAQKLLPPAPEAQSFSQANFSIPNILPIGVIFFAD